MEVIALIATALATGAAAGVQASTSEAVGGLYARLRQRVRERLGERSAELDPAIEAQRHRDTSAPDPVAPELRRLLEAVQAGQDEELRALADEVLRQPAGARGSSVRNVWISDSQGTSVDGPQWNTFYNAAAPPVTPGEGGM
ncbi:hypothetical protein PV735_37760 [Streptomyces turgidiscabies]|uniref:RHIM domain-containing protein n=1 Tax=Streptomyces turgidiscabies (strain Car8) TaxID=698760 RepID=L7F5R8_STRT8|nr:hypothetical protein [Streptomyces turgidiscabies]ELP65990.1 hypothetical protein STRTUCAR8_01993 [Streptomyces turgidiscabies Car8]MDX3498393.1 hypothetical protein [Streptomyces turgidiscabies]GAQ74541.1 hypothetical protein T45_06316 [Streptomyces turgidiscabies]